jgi:hypothetical protein
VANTLVSRIKRHRKGELLTPMIDEFFRKASVNDGVQFSAQTMSILSRLFLAPDRNRAGSFSASGLAGCMRAQVLARNDEEKFLIANERREAIFFNGHWVHLKWDGILLEMGVVKWPDPDAMPMLEVPIEIPEWNLRGTLDAIVTLDEDWIVDVKGVGINYWQMFKRGEIPLAYLWQQQAYMRATDIPRAMLLVENKGTGEYIEMHLPPPDSMIAKQMEARVKALNWHVEREQLPKALPDFPRDRQCQDCPFLFICPEATFRTGEEISV